MSKFDPAVCSANSASMKGVLNVKVNGENRKIGVVGDGSEYEITNAGKDTTTLARDGVTYKGLEAVELRRGGKLVSTMYFDLASKNYVSVTNEGAKHKPNVKDYEYNQIQGCRVTTNGELSFKKPK
jgi:nucleoside-triphosphatase THEP1